MSTPEFIIYCGPMFSSKTSNLLMTLEKFKYQNKLICAFKPTLDDRYSSSKIVSHNGISFDAITISKGSDIIEYLSKDDIVEPNVIAVDEAFMISGVADTLIWLFRNGFNVVVSTLELSSNCKVFHEIEKMTPWATQVVKCSAVCTVCGADARYTHKKAQNDDEIFIGGSESFEPRCYLHHNKVKDSTSR